ncbi:hypothetical protein INS49_004399 [Diaporthe citri]|uniref:uncharacterized protein n=1 Tax=Diaporthe citri TaxID=83186 RepID=UPI001C7F62C0|nr:uncharacterized protein INS49_004399 [Diaporthe citri]KAG6354382.1 hypothetical protein INS49_004399 [Diaporthe citri]
MGVGGKDSRVELQVHDFFTPQPVKGARAYFTRSVLHDWPDEQSCSREEKSQDQVASVFRVSQFMEDVEKNYAIIQAANNGYVCKRGIGIYKDKIQNFKVIVDAYASDMLSDGFDYPHCVCGQGIVFRMSGCDVS